ncbi:MAG TPA: hypothetical protein PLP27_12530 [Crocinitomicaceae bacterium]|nr:hypothetical protein [Crocinitomicaceae bacterium]
MYQIEGKQLTCKLTDQEREQVNEFAKKWQTTENVVFSNGKQLVLALLTHCKQLENSFFIQENNLKKEIQAKEELENELLTLREQLESTPQTTENSEIKQQLIETLAYQEPPTDEQLFADVLEIINTPLEPAPTVEVIKEVERQLLPTEILLNLTAKEKEILDLIARYRFSTKEDNPRKTTSELIHAMVFNKGTLLNEHGRFKTYINNKKLN